MKIGVEKGWRDERPWTWDQQPEKIIKIHDCKRNTWHCQGLKIVAEFRQTISAYVMWKHRTPGKN